MYHHVSPKNHHLSRTAACIVCHHVMGCPLIAIGGYSLQVCSSGVNILDKQADKHSKGQS